MKTPNDDHCKCGGPGRPAGETAIKPLRELRELIEMLEEKQKAPVSAMPLEPDARDRRV